MRQEEPQVRQSEYQKALDEGHEQPPKPNIQTVRYWSDFARVFYHPRSIIQVNDYELGSTILPFEKWTNGEELFEKLDKYHDLLDRDVRPWVEECDQMQGIQIVAGADDAWGGFAAKYVESLRDEHGKTSLWFWGLEEDRNQLQRARRFQHTVNTAQSLQAISTLASMYIPLAVPSFLPSYVRLDRASQWQAMGLLSMAMESMTLPSRQKPGNAKRGLLGDLEAALNANGSQKITELQCSVVDQSSCPVNSSGPWTEARDDRLRSSDPQPLVYEDEVEKANRKLDMSFSSGEPSQTALSIRQWEKANHVFAKVESVRGLLQTTQNVDGEEEAMSRKRRRLASLPSMERYCNPSPYPLLNSFPEILVEPREGEKKAAIHGSLATTSQISKRTKGLQNMVFRMVDVADREALANGLGEIAEAYEEGWDSGSDVDSD